MNEVFEKTMQGSPPMPMWLLKKEKEKKAAEEAKAKGKTSSAPKGAPLHVGRSVFPPHPSSWIGGSRPWEAAGSKDSQGSDVDLRYDGPDPRYVDDGPASPKDGTGRRRSLGGHPSSPKSGGPASPPPGRCDRFGSSRWRSASLRDSHAMPPRAAASRRVEGATPLIRWSACCF